MYLFPVSIQPGLPALNE